ncbi:MAG TPA: L-aspartate oxidase [Rhizomicrobium sp.]|jgi:L-aspartate oxidase|nr:L-aspartate oxidase [Rhizomicrobium sp.]
MRTVDNTIEAPGAIVLGAGIAGLFSALKLAPFPALVIASGRSGRSGSSAWAQGGIAAAMGGHDSPSLHAQDTLAAAAGTGDARVAELVASEAPHRIDDLLRLGVPFDRDSSGGLALAREAAHSQARIVHVSGDRAGAAIMETLSGAAAASPSITIAEGFEALELAMQDGRAIGLFARYGTGTDARLVLFRAPAIIFATGGAGALYAVTTNPLESRGQGLGIAARAGAVVADAEFVQFHPTAIDVGGDPAPLATEALRGEGAILVDEFGRRFMPAIHPAGELAPRDVVARAIHREIARGRRVFLNCREAIGNSFAMRFPTVHAACINAGIDPAREPIPVAPAAHYHMGGIASDEHGRSSIAGLWCVGECASTGLHGANRLASNSLVEALVFGARVAENVKELTSPRMREGKTPLAPQHARSVLPEALRRTMTSLVGVEREETDLRNALATVQRLEHAAGGDSVFLNALAAAKLIAAAALERRESIGAHFRRDYPQRSVNPRRSSLTLRRADEIALGSTASPGAARKHNSQ